MKMRVYYPRDQFLDEFIDKTGKCPDNGPDTGWWFMERSSFFPTREYHIRDETAIIDRRNGIVLVKAGTSLEVKDEQ